jgi:hypothetical protein
MATMSQTEEVEMRRLVMLLVLASLTGWPQTDNKVYFTSNEANGLGWTSMDQAGKISFVVGMNTGGAVLTAWAFAELPVCSEHLKTKQYPMIINGELIKELDKFYETAANVPLPVSVPVAMTYLKLSGASKEDLETLRASMLKAYVK